MSRPSQRIPGYDVDRVNIAAGLRELKSCGYEEPKTVMVIEYALVRWAHGEEEQAQRGAIDRTFHGISLTCWYRVLAAAMADPQIGEAPAMGAGRQPDPSASSSPEVRGE